MNKSKIQLEIKITVWLFDDALLFGAEDSAIVYSYHLTELNEGRDIDLIVRCLGEAPSSTKLLKSNRPNDQNDRRIAKSQTWSSFCCFGHLVVHTFPLFSAQEISLSCHYRSTRAITKFGKLELQAPSCRSITFLHLAIAQLIVSEAANSTYSGGTMQERGTASTPF